MPDESPKYPKRTYLIPVVNFTRYFTRDLEVLVDMMTATRWYGVIIVKHYSPPKGSTFNADPLMVKFDRLKQEDGFLHVGVVKPTRTGRPFVGVPELEALACMHSRTAPIALRRQLMSNRTRPRFGSWTPSGPKTTLRGRRTGPRRCESFGGLDLP